LFAPKGLFDSMVNIIYAPADSELAGRLQNDLPSALTDEAADGVTVVLLSPAYAEDAHVQQATAEALDAGQHIVSVLAQATSLPKLLDHLETIDFSEGYPLEVLVNRVRYLSGAGAGTPMRVRTPSVRAANRRFGIIVAIVVILMFLVGLYMVGVVGVQAPVKEYEALRLTETVTVQAAVDRFLPQSTADAANFPSTLEAVPTRLQPLLRDAATSAAEAE
jgi:hypothetical protein